MTTLVMKFQQLVESACRVVGLWEGCESCYDRHKEGIVDAYLELLQKGIRDVCLPNFGAHTSSELEWIDRRAQEAGS